MMEQTIKGLIINNTQRLQELARCARTSETTSMETTRRYLIITMALAIALQLGVIIEKRNRLHLLR
jgi:hypothetical protein